MSVQRPDSFFVSVKEGSQELEFYFDGELIVFHDVDANAYAEKAMSGSIDEAVNLLRDGYQSDPPLSDLLESDIYAAHMSEVTAASYVGASVLRGQEVHHLAFASDGMDWQIWIADGDQPAPVMLQILPRDRAYWPYFQAWFTNWEFGVEIAADTFAFQKPEGGIGIQFVEDSGFGQ